MLFFLQFEIKLITFSVILSYRNSIHFPIFMTLDALRDRTQCLMMCILFCHIFQLSTGKCVFKKKACTLKIPVLLYILIWFFSESVCYLLLISISEISRLRRNNLHAAVLCQCCQRCGIAFHSVRFSNGGGQILSSQQSHTCPHPAQVKYTQLPVSEVFTNVSILLTG